MSALTSDVIIAGGVEDFMQVRHLTLRGDQREIGHALGRIARDELGVDKSTGWTDPEASARHAAWLAEAWPAQHARRLGAAAAFGIDPDDHREDLSHLHYDWAAPGCSNCYYPPATTASGHGILSRNYDFTTGTVFELMGQPAPPHARPATARPFLIEMHPDEGYSTLTMTAYELLGAALDGMNSAGLGVALMATVELLRGGGPSPIGRNGVGLNEIQLLRFLLERAGSVEEARRLLLTQPQYTMWVPCHLLIADASGASLLWSRDAGELLIEGRPDRPLCATNHIPGRRLAEIPQRAESVERLARLERASQRALGAAGGARLEGIIEASRAVAATQPIGEGQYQGASPARTLWHGIYDLADRVARFNFYLGEGPGGEIRRSPRLEFPLTAP